ncbi:MAG: acyl-CoA synthetase [Burkholderiaceae bacterium]
MTMSNRAVPLDRVIGERVPVMATAADVAAIESIPLTQRLAATNTYDAIRAGAARNPDAAALVFLPNADPGEEAVTISYRQFVGRVTQAANLFHSLGVGPDDVVTLLLPLVPQAFFVLFGAEAAGIANPVNAMLEPHQLAEILRAANTRVLVTLGPTQGVDIWEKVEKIRGELPNLEVVLQVGGERLGDGARMFDELVAQQPADHLVSGRVIGADDTAAYFHTGGTTGTPKLVRHSHLNQVYQAWVCNVMLPWEDAGTLLFGLPLFHVGGALTQALSGFALGSSLVIVSPAGWRNPNAVRGVWKLVERYRPQVLSGVPTVLAAALAVPVGDADISSLRCAAGGGSAIPVAVGESIRRQFGLPVYEVYGMTETASVHTIAFHDRELRLGSVGHPVPYSRVRAVRIDADGRYAGDCETDEIGVIAMAGPGVFTGYLNEEHNRGAFVEPGWVNSGDLGRIDAQGYVWITGRAKDLIIRGGHNIDPAGIEEAFFQHPAVAFAAVVGQPDAYAGELPLAYVQLKPGASATVDALHQHVRERTPERAAVPVEVILVDEIPLTGVGKVFKPALRWDAARRVFDALLQPVRDAGAAVAVSVGAHGTHGSLATVTVSGVEASRQAEVMAQVTERLAPFSIRSQVVFE